MSASRVALTESGVTDRPGLCVLVVSDVRLTRDGLSRGLAEDARAEVAVAPAAEAALARVAERRPDVIVVDVRTEGGLDAVRRLAAESGVPVVALAVGDTDREVLACAEAGAAGYVTRDAALGDLVAVLQSVVRGESLCSPRVAASLFRRLAALASRARTGPAGAPLTAREREIALLLDQGLSNGEIARRLAIRLPTVKNHVHHILEKLQARRRGEAVARLRRVDPTVQSPA